MIATDCCRHCPCKRPAQVTRTAPADIAIVVDHPTDIETKKDTWLQSDSGSLIRMVLQSNGLDVDDCYICSALNCRPLKNATDSVKKNAMLACRPRIVEELKEIGPSKVLCLGPIGFSALTSADKVMPITKHRGKWHQAYGMDVFATFNPTMVMGVHEYFRDLDDDIAKFVRMDGADPTPNVEEWVIDDVDEAKVAFDFIEGASFVSLDVETTGFSYYKDDLLAVGLGVLYDGSHDGVSIIFDENMLVRRETWSEICYVLEREDQVLVMHNGKFDLKFIRKALEKFGLPFLPRRIADTMLAHYCVDERAMGQFQSHSLKNLARVRYDAPDYDIQMGKWLKAWADAGPEARARLRKQMRTYLALDCYYTARLYPDLINEIMEESLDLMWVYDNLLIPGSLALCDVEYHGAQLDRKFYEKTSKELARRSKPILERLQKNTGNKEFNPNSPKQVAQVVYSDFALPFGEKQRKQYLMDPHAGALVRRKRRGQPVPRNGDVAFTSRRGKLQEGPTAKAVLKALSKLPQITVKEKQVLDDILMYRNLIKNAGTYVNGMLDRIDDDDRIRGDFLPHGTSTGRLSSSNPNLQNIPEASHTKIEVRNGFIAPAGYGLIGADYSQLELRIAAHCSDDDNFCQMFIEGRDPHQEVAYAFFQKPSDQVTPYERYMAKCVNFGVVYGRGAESIAMGPEMEHVVEIGGNRWTTEEVREFFDKFFGHFPDFFVWCEQQKRFAYEHQYIQSPLGRRRRFPMIPRNDGGAVGRQAVNTPIQGTASDFTLSSLIRINERFKKEKLPAHLILTIHDANYAECHLDCIDEAVEIMREEMEDNVPIESRVPFEVEIKVGHRWGDLEKVKDLPSDVFAVEDV